VAKPGSELFQSWHFTQNQNCLPARATHTIFCHPSALINHDKGIAGISMQQPDYRIYAGTETIS